MLMANPTRLTWACCSPGEMVKVVVPRMEGLHFSVQFVLAVHWEPAAWTHRTLCALPSRLY